MKANLKIKFLEINGQKVNKKIERLVEPSTRKTLKILCEQIELYFKKNKIKTKVEFEL